MKRGSITLAMLVLIQVLVSSAFVGTFSPSVSAACRAADTGSLHTDFQELPPKESDDLGWLNRADYSKRNFVPGEVLVKFKKRGSIVSSYDSMTTGMKHVDELNEKFELQSITHVFSDVYKLTLPKDADVLQAAREYEATPEIEYAEPNGIYLMHLAPNDNNYTQQWAHQVIESEDAWNVTTGDPAIVIAVVDSGVDYDHPDLAANMWVNSDEIPNNDIDDDANGFVDDVRGWDFVQVSTPVYPGEDGTEPDNDPMDFLGHGTLCAGIVAAVGDNGIGIAGMTWNSKIMAVRSGYAVYGGGVLSYEHTTAGIYYAADNGADIISMSFGGDYRSKAVYDAVKYAYDKGAILIASAGNENWRVKSYPAAYEEVIAVTATDQNDDPAYFTNFGNWVEIAAPGVAILSTVCPNATVGPLGLEYPYDFADGTSVAAPHVAGLAALVLSRFPYMTRDQVRIQLRQTAVDLPSDGFDGIYGYGRINASGAVNQDILDHDLFLLNWKLPFASEPNDTVTVKASVLNFGNNTGGWNTTLLDDGFEEADWDTHWDDNGVASWEQDDSQVHSGPYSARARQPNNMGNITSDDLNASGAFAIYIEFWFRKHNTESSDYTLYYFNGSNYNLIDELHDNGIDDAWIRYEDEVTDSQYFVSNFRMRLDATLGGGENVWLDDVLVKVCFSATVTLLVNGTEQDSKQIPLLERGETASVTLSWTPMDEGTYNVTTYVEPMPLEPSSATGNNAQSACSWVSSSKEVVVPQGFPTIEEAIETSNLGIYNGDATIRLSGGTYGEYDLLIQNMLTSLTVAGESSQATVLSGNLSFPGPCIFANSDNVTIRDLKIQNSYVGAQLWGGNCIISGTNIRNTRYGIVVSGYYNNSVRDNILWRSLIRGIRVTWSSGHTIINNTVEYATAGHGLSIGATNNTLISGNTVTNSKYGLWLSISHDNVLTSNTLTNNAYNFEVDGNTLSDFIHDIDTTNTVDGKPIYYLINQSDLVIDPTTFPNVGYLGLVNSTGITVRDLIPSKNAHGVLCAFVEDCNIQNVTTSDNYYGIYLVNSQNTTVVNSSMTDDYYGVYLMTSTNSTIANNTLSESRWGIAVQKSTDNTIEDNTLTSYNYGIELKDGSEGNAIVNNTMAYTNVGINVYSSDSNILEGNTVTQSTHGIYLYGCENSILNNNNMTENSYNFFVDGLSLGEYMHSIDTSNTVNGKPVYYFISQEHLVIDPSTFPSIGYIGLVNSTDVTVKDVTSLTNNGQGVLFAYVTDSAIQNVTSSNNYHGIYFVGSNSTNVSGNTLLNNEYGIRMLDCRNNTIDDNFITEIISHGVHLEYSGDNIISNNTITEVDKDGVYMESSGGNIISNNTVSYCSREGLYSGILFSNSGNNTIGDNIISHNVWGVELDSTGNNTISNNNITDNTYGIYLWYCDSGNTILGNIIANNSDGFHIVVSSSNLIYHNNLITNTRQVYSSASSSSWDNGTEGNHWSDYEERYPNATEIDGSGIWDTPYVINENNQDNYPLTNPWGAIVYALGLRVMDWDMTDCIQGAYVHVDSEAKPSDANGWANWTGIDGTVSVKVEWHGVWVNGTFSVVVDSNRTVDIQCNIFDITVTTVEEQGAVLQYVNVTVYNSTNGMIRSGITDSDGKTYVTNVPNSTLTITCYDGASPQQVIANTTRAITIEDQAEIIICDENSISISQQWGITADYYTSYIGLIPFCPSSAAIPAFHPRKLLSIFKCLRTDIKGLKERVKTIRSKPSKKGKEVKAEE